MCAILKHSPTSASNTNPHSHRRLPPCGPGHKSIFIARPSFSFLSALERVVQFSRSLRGRHSTALRRSSANALSPLHQVTVYARPQHVRYSTVSRSRLHRCSVVIPSPLDRDPTVYFSMLGRVMIYSNVYNVLFNRLKAFLDCSVFTFQHSCKDVATILLWKTPPRREG